ncbi:MAG: phospholipase D-like domain-containing protein [Nitrospirota bacterium]
MRFKSPQIDGYVVYAVSGVNTISFAIDFENADTTGLLGFAVEREDHQSSERYFMRGFKIFKELIPHPYPNMEVSTFDHPIQSFVWDDFTAKPEHSYTYFFYPITGQVKNLKRSTKPIPIQVTTEPLYSKTDEHDIFFNRGIASSQAYARKFGNIAPDKINDPEKQESAYTWLSRDLKDAILNFIAQAQKGDALLGCFYEFRYQPVADAFKEAIKRGVDIRIIIDAKPNAEGFPRNDNLKIIKKAGIPIKNIIKREANKDKIQHNKFIVFLKGSERKPCAVWTGSTNISEGGIFGQTNVGHWIKHEETAQKYKQYWDMLSSDPGGASNDDRSKKIQKNKLFKQNVVTITDDIEPERIPDIPKGITPIFSPRQKITMLNTYAKMLDHAADCSCITLAFGISDVFKQILADNTSKDQITFMLLEKKDRPNPRSNKQFTYVGAGNNVYKAWGSYIHDPLYQWTRETDTLLMGMNKHVR